MRLRVKHGTVVNSRGRIPADILCVDGKIASIEAPGSRSPVDDEIDASGLLVFPGFIDPHVHSRDPGLTHKEDFAHSSRAAAAGGITTLLEMPNSVPPVTDVATLLAKAAHYEDSAHVDFGLWALSLGADNLQEIPRLVAEGVVGVKLFWGYALHRVTKQLVYNLADEPPENLILPPDNGVVLELFSVIAKTGALLAAHCEDRGVLASAQRALARPLSSYEDLLTARPDTAEAASIALGVEFSRAAGCRFHVVHMSSERGVAIVRQAQKDGISVSAETCPHYLSLTDRDFASIGALMKVYPPVRTKRDQDALWGAVGDGTICSLGSDHAPHTIDEKRQSLAVQPAGTIGVETLVPVMLNQMSNGRIDAERLAWVLSEGTARLYGLYPRKGALLPGSDADFTLVDPEADFTIMNESLHSKHPISPWHRHRGRGRVRLGILRGEVIMRDGSPDGPPRGQFVRSKATGHPDHAASRAQPTLRLVDP
jgi:allantoinase